MMDKAFIGVANRISQATKKGTVITIWTTDNEEPMVLTVDTEENAEKLFQKYLDQSVEDYLDDEGVISFTEDPYRYDMQSDTGI